MKRILETEHVNEMAKSAFGCWIIALWEYVAVYNPNFTVPDQKEYFFAAVERLLRDGKAVFSPPEELWSTTLGTYDTPLRKAVLSDVYGDGEDVDFPVWDIAVDDQVDYIRNHFPRDVSDANDMALVDFWYGNQCPRIGWVHPDTGKIIAS